MHSLVIPRGLGVLAGGTAASNGGALDGDSMSYAETTMLEIYGRPFEHTDANELERQ